VRIKPHTKEVQRWTLLPIGWGSHKISMVRMFPDGKLTNLRTYGSIRRQRRNALLRLRQKSILLHVVK